MKKLAPSILSADFAQLGAETEKIEKAGAHIIHVDVMDGHFVPNISYGATVMKSLLGKTKLPFDVHLMIENADKYIPDFVTENTGYITVHQEACTHLDRTIEFIKSFGAKAGVALNPATPPQTLEYVADKLDMVLVMSVNPGFGGQSFIDNALTKIKKLDDFRKKNNLDFEIEVDGGVNLSNVREICDAGTDIIVAGSSIFGAEDIGNRVGEFLELL